MFNEAFPDELLLIVKPSADVPGANCIQEVDSLVVVRKGNQPQSMWILIGAIEITSDKIFHQS